MSSTRAHRDRVPLRLAILITAVVAATPIASTTALANAPFAPVQWYPVGSSPEAVAIGDVTGDGRNDVVMTTSFSFDPANDYRLWVFAQRSDGHLAAPVSYATRATYSGRPSSVAVGDLTGDGRADVVLGLAGLGIELFPQAEGGSLGPSTLTPSTDSRQIRLGHLDADGDLDVAGIGWGSDTVTVFLNDGAGGLGAASGYPALHDGYDDLEVADVTGDDLDDLVVMSGQGYTSPNVSVVAQLAAGGFGSAVAYDIGANELTHGIGVGDVNGDGYTDVVASHGGNKPNSWIAVFQGNEAGTLEAPINVPSYDIPEPVDVADLDLDGDSDIVTVHGGWNRVGVYRQQPGGSIGYEELYAIPYASHYEPHGLAVGDISDDGSPDVVIADYNHGLVVLRNNLPSPPTPTLPGAPELNSATRLNGRISLNWFAPGADGYAPISGYKVYRGTSSGDLTLLATLGAVGSYSDYSVVNGTTYYYRVSALNGVGEGAPSIEKSATAASVPGAPSLVSAIPGDTTVALTWQPPSSDGGSPIIDYTVTASPGGATCRTAGTSCTVTGLTNGTSYSFTVKAVNQLGYGPASNALSATPQIPGDPPSAPRNLATSPNQPEGILLTWSAPSSQGTHAITSYRIYRGTSTGGAVHLATVGNVSSYMDTSVVNGGRYYYQVSAVNLPGEGPRSAEVVAQRGTAPSAPRNLSASAKPTGVTLKWTAPTSNGGSPVTGYRIYRGTVSAGETYLVSVAANSTSYIDKAAVKGTTYFYWVTAVNVLGIGPASNEVNVVGR